MKKYYLILSFFMMIGLLFVSAKLENIKPKINYNNNKVVVESHTPYSDKLCIGEHCTLTVYSGIRNVYEDGKWKKIENARSLKGSGIKCNIFYDGLNSVNCLDFNYTAKKVRWVMEDPTLVDRPIPIKMFKKKYGEIPDLKELKSYRFNKLNEQKELIINSKYDDIVHFGLSSTIVTLQDADTENLEDVYINQYASGVNKGDLDTISVQNYSGFQRQAIIKFDISVLPSTAIIQNAKLKLNLTTNTLDYATEGFNVSIYQLYNQSWVEEYYTWNTRPADSEINQTYTDTMEFDGTTAENFKEFDVKNTVQSEVNNGDYNVSFFLKAHDQFGSPSTSDNVNFASKEYAEVSSRPILWINYTTPCDYTGGNWVIATYCEFNNQVFNVAGNLSINNGGILNLTNVTVNFINNNQYIIFDDAGNTDKLILNEYSKIN